MDAKDVHLYEKVANDELVKFKHDIFNVTASSLSFALIASNLSSWSR